MSRSSVEIHLEIPHGSYNIPECVRPHLDASDAELRDDTDHGVNEFYPHLLLGNTESTFSITRSIVDANRGIPERPLGVTPDGAFKTTTQYGKQIWKNPAGPPVEILEQLTGVLENYYSSLEETIQALCEQTRSLVIWCAHSYTPIPVQTSTASKIVPAGADENPLSRPVYMVANGGNDDGSNPAQNGLEQQGLLDIATIYEKQTVKLTQQAGVLVNPAYPVGVNYPYTGTQSINRYQDMIRRMNPDQISIVLTEINQCLHGNRAAEVITVEAHRQIRDLLKMNLYPQI